MSSTVVRINSGAQTQHINNYQTYNPTFDIYGKVFHIVRNDKDPGYTDWSSIGKIYFTNTSTPPPKEINDEILTNYEESNTAIPLIPYINYFPSIGELVYFLIIHYIDLM
jgi:hypothetical protein